MLYGLIGHKFWEESDLDLLFGLVMFRVDSYRNRVDSCRIRVDLC